MYSVNGKVELIRAPQFHFLHENTESRVVSGGKTPRKSHPLLSSLFSFAVSKRLPLKGMYSVQEKDNLIQQH